MSQNRDDVEASAHLMMKEEDEDHDRERDRKHYNFDDDNDDANATQGSWRDWRSWSNWSSGSRQHGPSYTTQLWRRVQSIPSPSWLPVRKLSQLNPRYLIFAAVILCLITALTYHTRTSSRHSESSNDTFDPVDSEFCTTWPVDEYGQYDVHSHDRNDRIKLDSIAPPNGWRKPKGLRVVAMVFFGRRRYVDILDCYLQQNLASNGGYLDEVWFMAHTDDERDMAWLQRLVKGTPGYRVVGQEDCNKNDREYGCLWAYASEDETIFIKLDDDIIYIHHDAIPQLVHTRLAVPHAFAVSAQLVNSPITGLEQFHHGAIYPFVPDPRETPRHSGSETWRPSKLDKYPASKLDYLKNQDDQSVMYPDVPYDGHPYVLLSEDNFDLLHTSMGRYDQHPGKDFIAFSPIWRSWAMGAQQQYSLLYNLEKNQISRYFFGRPAPYPANAKGPDMNRTITTPKEEGQRVLGGEQIFDTQFRRYNLNFCAVWGADIKDHLPMDNDDENAITHAIPKKTGRPFIIDTRSVVGHFSFYTQIDNIRRTDLLDRWRAFANEAVCKPDNLKKPWDHRCSEFRD
ncbi:hypothetical protein GGR50DRAFT_533939 [Xylaria sp. CBS 124048]|nr:hypothetical protein GGR50DRAFT_533939 [Xylaria sp. CBS 124048]